MKHKRQWVQFGWVCLKARKNGPDVWVLRYRENLPDGSTTRRSVAIGTVKEFPNESQARKAALSWLFSMNAEASNGAPVSFGAVIRRYLAEEIPERPVGNPPPSGGELWLKYLEGKTTVWWAILGLSVFTDFLFVPVALSLYLALKRVNKNAMLIASAFVGLFVVLDLAVLWTNYASLLTLSRLHTAATTDVQRAAYVAAANYASAVLESHTEVFYSIVDLSVAILIIGFVMLQGKGIFNKTTAYLGVGAGIFGIVSISGFFVTIIINALLVTAWVLFVGYRLLRLGLHGQSSGSV